jgi:hypothetical protein
VNGKTGRDAGQAHYPLSGYTLEAVTVSRRGKKGSLLDAGGLGRRSRLRDFLGLRRGLHAWKKDVTNLHGSVRLAMAAQAAVILSPAKMLNVELLGRMIHDFGNDSHAIHRGLADPQVVATVVKEYATKLQTDTDFGVPIVDLDHVAFAHPVLPGPILEHCIHSGNPAICLKTFV